MEDIMQTEIMINHSYALKVNSMFKKMGFKKVFMKGKLIEDLTYEKELTLYIKPTYEEGYGNEVYLGSSSLLGRKLENLKGFFDYSYLKGCPLNKTPIILIDGNIKEEIGCYLKERNIIILYYDLSYTNHSLGKNNEIMFYFLNYLTKWIKENPIKQVDISDKIKAIVYQKFTIETKTQINNLKKVIRDSEYSLKEYYESIAYNIKKVKESKVNCLALEHGLKNINEKIDEDIKEIKKLKFVKKVNISGLGIRIDFDKIYINVDDKDIFMGDYYVYLLPTSIKIKNKNPIVFNNSTFHSPHIQSESICFGEEKLQVYKLLGEGEYKKVVHFIYLYLKTYNSDDTYVSMGNWIKARENDDEWNSNDNDNENEDDVS